MGTGQSAMLPNADYDSFCFICTKKPRDTGKGLSYLQDDICEAKVCLYYPSNHQNKEGAGQDSQDLSATLTDPNKEEGASDLKGVRSVMVTGETWLKVHDEWIKDRFPLVCETDVLSLTYTFIAVIAPPCYRLMDILKVALFEHLQACKISAFKKVQAGQYPEQAKHVQKQLDYLDEMSLLQLISEEHYLSDVYAKEINEIIERFDIAGLEALKDDKGKPCIEDARRGQEIFTAIHKIYIKMVKYDQQIELSQLPPKVMNVSRRLGSEPKLRNSADKELISFPFTILPMINELKTMLSLSKATQRDFLRLEIKGLGREQDIIYCLTRQKRELQAKLNHQESKAQDDGAKSPRHQTKLMRRGSQECLLYTPGTIKPQKREDST